MSYIKCPTCGEAGHLPRVKRGLLERHITRVDWNKHKCEQCSSIVFQHRFAPEKVESSA